MASRDRNRRFWGRHIYVTGAASGIGRATARLLAEGGARLALIDRDEERLAEAAQETGGIALPTDLLDADATLRSVAAAGELLGGLDGIVNCAGMASGALLASLDPEEWSRVMTVNLTAPYRICRAALPLLREHGNASIVNVGSGAALRPSGPGASAYAASKGGLLSFSKALAAELAPEIRVNAVCPGIVDTPMTAGVLHGPDANPGFLGQYALKRAADPSEVAEGIAFLMSEEASFVTGIVMSVDGGRSFH